MDFFGVGMFVYLFAFVHILLMVLFFVSFYKYIDESDSKKPKIHGKI
jgi:hypothetical protein